VATVLADQQLDLIPAALEQMTTVPELSVLNSFRWAAQVNFASQVPHLVELPLR
jgi:hypothetical protein